MAIKKATTTSDITAPAEPIPGDGKYVTVKNPWDGAVTQVPAEIVESLLASGYTKSK